MFDSHNQRNILLALSIFLGALLLRVILDLIFFSRSGWFSSHLIEVWFYYGVAQGVRDIFSLSILDPTFLLLRLPGWLFPVGILYQAVVFEAALISALTAVLIFYWLSRSCGRETGLWGGIVFALLPAPVTLSLVNFSHDLVQVPLVVLFFWAAWTAVGEGVKRGRRGPAALAALACLLLGLKIGPLMAGALLIIIIYSIWLFLCRLRKKQLSLWASAVYLLGLVALNYVLYLVMRGPQPGPPTLLKWIAPLAMKFRGIDLMAQVKIRVGDLQPLPRDAFWNRYTLFIFFLPWGFWTAFKKREFFSLTLFCFSLALALVVNRGARLLDLSVVVLTALALSNWKKPAAYVTAAAVLMIITLDLVGGVPIYEALDLKVPRILEAVYFGIPFNLKLLWRELHSSLAEAGFHPNPMRLKCAWLFAGFFALTIIWAFLLRIKKRWPVVMVLPVIAFLQGYWVLLAANPSSDQIEYEAYRWLNDRSRPGEKIFAAWNQGYFIGAVTHLDPITTPERIDLSVSRLYWEEEAAAARDLRRRGVTYVHVSSRYFGITSVNEKNDTFTMRGNTIIGPQPVFIQRFSRMRRALLFRLIYEPKTLRFFTPIYEKIDPEKKVMIRIFKVK